MDYDSFFRHSLQKLRDEGRYRTFAQIIEERDFPRVRLKRGDFEGDAVVWCSNEYLGLCHHPAMKTAVLDAIDAHGIGAGGTRNISGTRDLHARLEQDLADLHGHEAGLVFSSGYVSNQAALATLGSHLPDCVILSDANNHASIIEGIRAARCEKIIYRHADMNDLEAKLKTLPSARPKLIVSESLYSMEGDIAPLTDIVALAECYGAMSYLDEVHAVGLYGTQGAGLAEQMGVAHRFSIIQGTLGKAFGLMGGYIVGQRDLVDFVRSCASGFIFTTALPPMMMAGTLAALAFVRANLPLRTAFHAKVKRLQSRLLHAGLLDELPPAHITPIMIRDAHLCNQAAERLLRECGVYLQPINYPTVPKGTERFRMILTPLHTETMEDDLVTGLETVIPTDHREAKRIIYG